MGTDVPIFVADGEAPARRVKVSPFYLVRSLRSQCYQIR